MAVFGAMSSVFMVGDNGIALSSGASGSAGLYYTSDSGAGWTVSNLNTVFSSGYTNNFLYMDGVHAIAAINLTGVYYSSDSGHTWTQSTFSLTPPLGSTYWSSVCMTGSHALVATDWSSVQGMFYSDNYGQTWTPVASGGSIPAGSTMYGINMNSDGKSVGVYDNGTVYSTDFGHNWVASSGTPSTYTQAVSMNASGNVIIDSNAGFYYSTNSGASFTASTGFPAHTNSNPRSLFIDPTNNCIAYDGTLLYYSSNGGSSFTSSGSSGGSQVALYMSGNYAIAGCSGSFWKYSINNGVTWTPVFGYIGVEKGAAFLVGLKGIMSSTSALKYTVDGGSTWLDPVYPAPPPPFCFNEGSKILYLNSSTNQEEYIQIQDMRKGDLVKTVSSGYKKIEHIGYSKFYNNVNDIRSKNKLYKCSKTEYPEITEDLILTGCHSILVGNFKDQAQLELTQEILGKIYVTDNHYRLPACVDDRSSIYEVEGVHTIWHMSLEHDNYYMNYGIYANGLLVETSSNRMMVEISGYTMIE